MNFDEFVQIELPKRPFAENDGSPGQVLMRSNRPERPRELVWGNMPNIEPPFERVAGPAGVSGHRAVMVLPDGTVGHADPTQCAAYLGISKNAAVAGDPVGIATDGQLSELSWSWTPGQTVFFIDDGVLTQTVPYLSAVTPIGVALTATSIFITRQPFVFLGA